MIQKEGLLSAKKISKAELLSFFAKVGKVSSRNSKTFPDAVGILAFFEPSTRTRVSFERAGLSLGVRWISISSQESSLLKGESLKDTFQTLALNRPDFFVVRHSIAGLPHFVHRWTKLPVLNAGDGQNEHPTQGLLDAFTLWSRDPRKKWKVCFFGDVARSRVARSSLALFKTLGFSVAVCDDNTLATRLFSQAFDLKMVNRKRLKDFDVVMALRVQKERGSTYATAPLGASDLGPKTLVMHPGPVMLGQDLEFELCHFDSDSRLLIQDQVANGVRIRRALIEELLAAKGRQR